MSDTPVDTTVAHTARVWNYWLGGKDNYPPDREVGDRIRELFPEVVDAALGDRAFLRRAVTHLVEQEGVHQFLDIGAGLPTADNTHEVAQRLAPGSRVVYVDNDPLVLAHARALLTGTDEGRTEFVDSDLRETDRVLASAREVLDFDRPIALTLMGTMGHFPDLDEALGLVRAYVDALPAGSFLAVCDGVISESVEMDPEKVAEFTRIWEGGVTLPYVPRALEDFTRFFDGLDLVEPGVVSVTKWHPEPVEVGRARDLPQYCGLARVG
ncbi:SAM-dependent methyltransferase [Nocardiopsis sp. HNM0947]|uniref:SAM-dependent methyltransferase n=1 Tax=Nocardiopsis coralli TaxID=2772213 RepID=A0ABR9PEJ5_9ACTN|nr:SAM-dependent methyltransferase [Nocardiopsis coralli]MBE3002277.1 SAM-dependent methyltransferase [Nocardiopsis coralli]